MDAAYRPSGLLWAVGSDFQRTVFASPFAFLRDWYLIQSDS